MAKKAFRSYDDASAWARGRGVKSVFQWRDACKRLDFPNDIPKNPDHAYPNFTQRGGWGIFLGTGAIAPSNRNFLPYEDASAWAKQQRIKTSAAWQALAKQPHFPDNIPKNPCDTFADFTQRGGWGTFLGTGTIANQNRTFRSYESASAWARNRGVKNQREWRVHAKQPDFPSDIPASPCRSYRDFWQRGGWNAFLGVSSLNGISKIEMALKQGLCQVLNLDQARTTRIDDGGRSMHVDMADRSRRLVIEYDGRRWHSNDANDRRKTQRLTDAGWSVIRVRVAPLALLDPIRDVCVDVPNGTYWPTIETVLRHMQAMVLSGVLLDDGLSARILQALQSPIDEATFYPIMTMGWRSYEDASTWAQEQAIKSSADWKAHIKRPNFPADIPMAPHLRYPDFVQRGGWGVFLGTGAIAPQNRTYRSYESASAWAKRQGIETRTEWRTLAVRPHFPNDVPKSPDRAYSNFTQRGGWGAFLGTGAVAPSHRNFLSYDAASAWAKEQGVQSLAEWRALAKQPHFPNDIPKSPGKRYSDFWQRGGWGIFLGTGRKRGALPGVRRANLQHVIRLAKPTDLTPAILPSNDPAFVMPWAA